MQLHSSISIEWGETGGSETPTSHDFHSRFPPPSVGVPVSLIYNSCWKMLHNIAKVFSFSLGSHHFGNPASNPFSSHFPYPSQPLFSWAPVPLSPSTNNWKCLKRWPHYSQSSRENATPSSGTSPVAHSYEVPLPPPGMISKASLPQNLKVRTIFNYKAQNKME